MEDADSSVTRKRPRLDSGDQAHRSMSTDQNTVASPVPQGSGPAVTPTKSDAQSVTNGPEKTPSKVTINLRDTSHVGPMFPANGAAATSSKVQTEDDGPALSQDNTLPFDVAPGVTNAISISSSPSGSPEIEVAEVEDMNGLPGETVWKTLSSTVEMYQTQASLFNKFPCADRCHGAKNAMSAIIGSYDKGTNASFTRLQERRLNILRFSWQS